MTDIDPEFTPTDMNSHRIINFLLIILLLIKVTLINYTK